MSPLAPPARAHPAGRGQRGRRPAHARGAARGRATTCGCRRSATASRRSPTCAARRASPRRRGPTSCCSTSTCRARTGSRCSTRCAPTRRSPCIPVIVLTSSAARQDVEAALRPRGERVRGQAAGARRVHGPDRRDPRLLARGGAATLRLSDGRDPDRGRPRRARGRARDGRLAEARGRRIRPGRASAGRAAPRRALQRSILDSLQDGVVVYDEDDRIVFFNPAASEILGVSARVARHGRAHVGAARRRGPHDRRRGAARWRSRRAPASRAWASTSACAPRRATCAGRRSPRARCTRSRPATAATRWSPRSPTSPSGARRSAALERTNAELAQFAYVASHDLSEPLRMVSSYLQLLRRRYHGQIDEDADEFIDFAVEGANRMRALIEDLLAYSRAGRGAEPRPIDLGARDGRRALLARRGGGRRARAGRASARCRRCSATGSRSTQLLQNLVANALKFRSGASACVWVDGRAPARRRCGSITVADDGIGIDPRHRDRVFKMFQRLHDREAFEGTGHRPRDLPQDRRAPGRRDLGRRRARAAARCSRFTLPAVPAPALVDPADGRAQARRYARGAE